MKTQFFPRQAIPNNFFALHFHYTVDFQFRIWFDLDNSLTRWKRIFLKFSRIRNSRNSQSSVWKTIFFLGKLYQKLFALHSHYTGDSPYQFLFDFNNSLTRWKRPIFKSPIFAKFKSSIWNTNFFPRQATPKNFFALHSHYTGDTSCRFWFDLNNSWIRWNRPIFKIPFSRNSKVPYEKLTFFSMQVIPKILFVLTSYYTGDNP